MPDERVRRALRFTGYQFLYSRKNGLLKKGDLKKSREFARKVIVTDKFWEGGISFYTYLVGFQLKCNPHTRRGLYKLRHDD